MLNKIYIEENEILREANKQAKAQIHKLQEYIKKNDNYKILFNRVKETLKTNGKYNDIVDYMEEIE